MGKKCIHVGLCGAGGYTGQVVAKLLANHPYCQLTAINWNDVSDETDWKLSTLTGQRVASLTWSEFKKTGQALDLWVLATPPDVSMKWVSELSGHNSTKIIDLSGAFRLSATDFNHWYGMAHQAPKQLLNAHYGLSPFFNSPKTDSRLIANPGCYATCALMALFPILKFGLIDGQSIIIDAKSGVSGAGKKANPDLMFCEMVDNFFPYKIGHHQHVPEIKNALKKSSHQPISLHFTAHMLPVPRGISMTIYADCLSHGSDAELTEKITAAYHCVYQDYPLVVYHPINQGQNLKDKYLLSLKTVIATPHTHIGYFVNQGKLILFSFIDNLMKGAASQAVENINACFDLPIQTGL